MDRLASVGKLDAVIHGEDGHLARPSFIVFYEQTLVTFIISALFSHNPLAKNEGVQMIKCLKDGKICLKIKRKISWILIALKSLTKAITVKKNMRT